jgi:hypothetical protein
VLDARQGTIASKAKVRSMSVSPSRSRKQSTVNVTNTRGGSSKDTDTRGSNVRVTETRGGNAAVGAGMVAGEVKAKVFWITPAVEALVGDRPLQPHSLLIPGSWNTREASEAITPGISGQWKPKGGDQSKGY